MDGGREAKRFRAEITMEQEGCIMEGRCPEQHAATACLSFLAMPPQHRRALATRRGLCLVCLTHDKMTKCDRTREPVPKPKELWVKEHWLMTQQSGPDSSASPPHSGTEVVLVREGPRAGGAPHSGKRGPTISRLL